jgi:hypothetical protein
MADKPQTVKVEALKYHTTAGKEYQVGDTYDVPEDAVDNLVFQGMAVRTDRVEQAKAAGKAAEKAAKARSTAVEPMGIDTTAKPARVRKTATRKAGKK